MPPNTRDALYQGLPPTIKSALRSKLQLFQVKEEVLVKYFQPLKYQLSHWKCFMFVIRST